jgi:Domain of unknown function (DUF6933)
MIIRLSQKLAKKIKESPTESLPADPNPFADWSAHFFTADRAQYIILMNTPSLYSVVMYGRGVANDDQFLDCAIENLRDFMIHDGLESIYTQFIVPVSKTVRFSKALNRSAIGSMNELIAFAKLDLVENELPLIDTSLRLVLSNSYNDG